MLLVDVYSLDVELIFYRMIEKSTKENLKDLEAISTLLTLSYDDVVYVKNAHDKGVINHKLSSVFFSDYGSLCKTDGESIEFSEFISLLPGMINKHLFSIEMIFNGASKETVGKLGLLKDKRISELRSCFAITSRNNYSHTEEQKYQILDHIEQKCRAYMGVYDKNDDYKAFSKVMMLIAKNLKGTGIDYPYDGITSALLAGLRSTSFSDNYPYAYTLAQYISKLYQPQVTDNNGCDNIYHLAG